MNEHGYVRCTSGDTHININGFDYYFDKEGELHKTDGPALIDCEGVESYWLHGKMYKEEEWKKITHNDIEELFTL